MEDCRLVLSRFLFATMPRTIPATHAATDGDGTIARATMDGPGQIPASPQPAPNSAPPAISRASSLELLVNPNSSEHTGALWYFCTK